MSEKIKGTVELTLAIDLEIYDDGINDYTDQLYAQALSQLGIDDTYIERSGVVCTLQESAEGEEA